MDNVTGQFRELDEVFLEIASKWNSLDKNTQRYIATVAAGSRQQSRFIAMMSNYERTMELVDAANNSAGASQKQFEKTLESLETKLNKLANAWDAFTMHLANDKAIKVVVDMLTLFLTVINKILDVLPDGIDSIAALGITLLALRKAGTAITNLLRLYTAFKGADNFTAGMEAMRATIQSFKSRNATGFISALRSILSEAKLSSILEGIADSIRNIGRVGESGERSVVSLGTSLLKLAKTNKGVAVAIVVVTAALLYFYQYCKITEKQLTRMSAAAESLSQRSQELVNTLSDIEEQHTKFKDLSEILEVLVSGTVTWNEKLLESNALIGELIEKYPAFAEYVSIDEETGVKSIEERAWSDITKQIQEQQDITTKVLTAYTQRINVLDAQNESQAELQLVKNSQEKIIGQNLQQYLKESTGYSSSTISTAAAIAAKSYNVEDVGAIRNGATDEEIQEWAKHFGYTNVALGGPTRNKIKYTDALTGEEATITNEEIKVQLNVINAQEAAQEMSQIISDSLYSLGEGFSNTFKDEEISIGNDVFGQILGGDTTMDLSDISSDSIGEKTREAWQNMLEAEGIEDDPERQKEILGAYLGLDPEEMTSSMEYYLDEFEDLVEERYEEIEKAQEKRNKDFYTILAQGFEIDENSNDFKDYVAYFSNLSKHLDQAQKQAFINISNNIGENLGNDALRIFTMTAIQDRDNIQSYLDAFSEVDYTNIVDAYADLKDLTESTDINIANMAKDIMAASHNTINLGAQFQQVYTDIVSNEDFANDLEDAIEDNNGRISSTDIKDLANQNAELATFLDNSEMSATALAEAFTQVYKNGMSMNDITEAGLKMLDTMRQLDGIVDDVFDIVDNFNPARDTGEIADYFNEITDTTIEMYKGGEFGNAQFSSYMDLLFGDNWTNALDEAGGDVQKAGESFVDKIDVLQNNLYGAWEDLATNYSFGADDALKVMKGADGSIQIQLQDGMTSEDIVQQISDKYQVSTEYAKAMVADFKNYSPDFGYKMAQNDARAGMEDFISDSTYQFGDNKEEVTFITESSIESAAALTGLGVEKYKQLLAEAAGVTVEEGENIEDALKKSGIHIVDNVEDNMEDSIKNIKKGFNEIENTSEEELNGYKGIIDEFSEDDIFDIDQFQSFMSAQGVSEDTINQMIHEIASTAQNNEELDNLKFQINGIDVETEDLAEDGAEVAQVLDTAVTEHDWNAVGKAIAEGVISYFSGVTDGLKDAVARGAAAANAKIKSWMDSLHLSTILHITPEVEDEEKDTGNGTYDATDSNNKKKALKDNKKTNKTDTNNIVAYNVPDAQTAGSNENNGSDNGINELPEPLDKLYNTYQRINKELRLINKYQERYDRLLERAQISGVELEKNLEKQIKYYTLLEKRASYAKDTRQQQIKELLNERIDYIYEGKDGKDKLGKTKKLSNYFSWDSEYGLFTIDWKKLNKLADGRDNKKDIAMYEALVDEMGKFEGYQSDIEEANDNLEDAKNALEDIEKKGRDAYRELEDRIYDAIVYREQERIDKLEQINDAIDEANSSLVDAIQKNIDKIRQDRENEETEDDIAKTERRLSYLRRDTSNANAVEIKKLEEELADKKQDYTDTLIDQKISELQDQNDEAAQQRQQQIDLLQAQLDWDEENGQFWEEAHRLIKNGIDETGKLVETSELVALLKSAEGWEGLSSVGQMDWYTELQSTAAEGWTWLKNNLNTALGLNTLEYQYRTGKVSEGDNIKYTQGNNKSQTGTVSNGNAIYEGKKNDGVYFEYDGDKMIQDDEGNWITQQDLKNARKFEPGKKVTIRAKKNGSNEIVKIGATAGSDGIMYSNSTSKPFTNLEITTNGIYYTKAARKVVESNPKKYPGIKFKYATGGLADFTGPAWLDGSTSKPELVLNAKDTENFIQLKNVLRSLMNGGVNGSGNSGDVNYEIHIEVEKLSNDYDVEQVANKVKRMIVSDSKYRNVNAINKLR